MGKTDTKSFMTTSPHILFRPCLVFTASKTNLRWL